MARTGKQKLFENEAAILEKIDTSLQNPDTSEQDKKALFHELRVHYADLLDQLKLITKVSDRLQKKINNTNEELEEKNEQLQSTIDALTKARIGRKATTIVLIIAVVLFLISEGLLEPRIDKFLMENYQQDDTTFYSLGLKGLLALTLRPIEMVVEKTLARNARKKRGL